MKSLFRKIFGDTEHFQKKKPQNDFHIIGSVFNQFVQSLAKNG